MNRLASIVAVAGLIVAVDTLAVDTNGPTGAGSALCAEFLTTRPGAPDNDIHAQWAFGTNPR
jgi:hypothetical protein